MTFSANNVSLCKTIVPSGKILHIIQKLLKYIQSLDVIKTYIYDDISVRMLTQ